MQNSWHCVRLTGWSRLQRRATRSTFNESVCAWGTERESNCVRIKTKQKKTSMTHRVNVALYCFADTINAQRTDKEAPGWLKSIPFHSTTDPVVSWRGIQIYGIRKRDLWSLLIATPMDLQFGLRCFCSVNIPTLRREWYSMLNLHHHFLVGYFLKK